MNRNLAVITAILESFRPASVECTPDRPAQSEEEKSNRLAKAEKKRERKLERNRRNL